jgi:hypothetical protein
MNTARAKKAIGNFSADPPITGMHGEITRSIKCMYASMCCNHSIVVSVGIVSFDNDQKKITLNQSPAIPSKIARANGLMHSRAPLLIWFHFPFRVPLSLFPLSWRSSSSSRA